MRGTWGWRGACLLLGLGVSFASRAASPPPFADVEQVAAGGLHTCARTGDGRIWCWGRNDIAQLGVGEDTPRTIRSAPVPVPGLLGTLGLAAGDAHTCVITAERGVRCWGLNDAGQSGEASFRYQRGAPGAVDGLERPVLALALGGSHSCALLEGGEVRCWGGDESGQLGDGGNAARRATAAPVSGLDAPAVSLAAGYSHTCAALANGTVRCWGENGEGQLGDGTREDRSQPVAVLGLPAGGIRALAAGVTSSCAIAGAGAALHCWGAQYPLLGFGEDSPTARAYPGLEAGLVALGAGDYHYCALTSGGQLKCFGENIFGQFGNGEIGAGSDVETAAGLLDGVTQVDAGRQHTCARARDGALQCWGDNRFGQLAQDITSERLVPTQVSGLDSGVLAVGVGAYHACALGMNGQVKCWGVNTAQQLGNGGSGLSRVPVDVVDLGPGVRALAVGGNSACAITAERRVKCWGANFSNQLGIGGPPDTSTPRPVLGLGEVDVLSIGVGREHACALMSGGLVKCWGDNAYGQLGDGTRIQRATAVDVAGLPPGIRAIAAGYLHTCAITAGSGLKCWGINENGQLGDGSNTDRLTPVDVVGLGSGVVAVAPGGLHTCAVVSGGGVKCWGANYFGLLLGDGSSVDRALPADVPALRQGVVEVSAALFGTCVRFARGAMQCWGTNDGGPVGDNSTVSRPTPVDVAGLTRGVTAMGSGYGFGGHTCAVVSGAAKCWGENTVGQVGDGSTHGVPTPQRVLSNAFVRRVAARARGNDASRNSSSDASGRFVVFESDASNLVAGDSNASTDIFRLDRETGGVERVSVDDRGAQIMGGAIEPSISADGKYIVFVAPDAGVAAAKGESKRQRAQRLKGTGNGVYLRNLVAGTTQRMGSATMAGAGTDPQIAPAATAVAFTSDTPPAGAGPAGKENVYHVTLTPQGNQLVPGLLTCVSCKSLNPDGTPGAETDGESRHPAVSADGMRVAYETTSKNALAASPSPCPGGSAEILMRDLLAGSTQRMSPSAATPAANCGTAGSTAPSIDYAGDTLAFQSDSALDGEDSNGMSDIYVVQTQAPASPVLVSQSPDGAVANGGSVAPSLSGDGNSVAFVSVAQNLDLSFADNNDLGDVHTASLGDGDDALRVARLSRGPTGAESDAASERPALNFDGSRVAFDSASQTLAPGSGNEVKIYQRDNPLAAPVRTATFWKSSENGWGLTVFDQGSLLAPAWFTYDVDGEPTWFLIGGAFPQADGSYRGDLLRLTGTPFDRIEGPASLSANTIGSVSLRFQGDAALEFEYAALGVQQRKSMTRFPFGQRNFACTASPQGARDAAGNYTDLWTGTVPNAGWGLTLFHVDDSLFAGWYTYDTDGEAVFFVIGTTRQPDGSFAGQIFRQRDGTPFSQIDNRAASEGSTLVGQASFRFGDGDTGTFSYSTGGVSQSKAITRLLVGSRASVCESVDETD